MRDNDPALTAAQTADLSEENMSTAQDLSFDSTHTKLTSLTVTGAGGDVTANAAPALAASIAAVAICSGVFGKSGCFPAVSPDPVTAQDIKILLIYF